MFDMTTQGKTGLTGSEPAPGAGRNSSGMDRPAIAISTEECPAATTPTFFARDRTPGGVDARHMAVGRAADGGDLAILDDVDATVRSSPRIAPGDRVVARGAAAPLQWGPHHRITADCEMFERRAEGLGLFRCQPFIVDAVQPVRMDVPP